MKAPFITLIINLLYVYIYITAVIKYQVSTYIKMNPIHIIVFYMQLIFIVLLFTIHYRLMKYYRMIGNLL